MSIRAGLPWLRTALREMPIVLTAMLIGAALLGFIGGVVGLVVGLHTYPPTAWFAMLEVGVPAATLGCFLGVVIGAIAQWVAGARPGDGPVDDDFAGRPPGW